RLRPPGPWRASTLRHAASSVAPVRQVRGLPASLPGLVLAHQERGNETGRVIMATEIKLPRLGQGMESGTIVKWLKSEGDPVEKGEPLYELDTDKVTQEVEADASGVLLKIAVEGGEVEVGKTIAVIGEAGEQVETPA